MTILQHYLLFRIKVHLEKDVLACDNIKKKTNINRSKNVQQ